MIRCESYGGWKLLQIGPDGLFFYLRPLQDLKASSVGFRGVLEGFQRDLKPCGFRVVSEVVKLTFFQKASKTAV